MPTWKFPLGNAKTSCDPLREHLAPQEVEVVLAIESAAIATDKAVRSPVHAGGGNDTIRTREVLIHLDALGKKLGYETRSAQSKPEWLLDEIWFINRQKSWLSHGMFPANNWGAFEGIKLGCESEWHGKSEKILQDFAKLTVIKADFRVFVHSNRYYDDGNISAVDICKSIIRFSSGDRYLFLGFDWAKNIQGDHDKQGIYHGEFRVDLVYA